jgi:hypothetical protein
MANLEVKRVPTEAAPGIKLRIKEEAENDNNPDLVSDGSEISTKAQLLSSTTRPLGEQSFKDESDAVYTPKTEVLSFDSDSPESLLESINENEAFLENIEDWFSEWSEQANFNTLTRPVVEAGFNLREEISATRNAVEYYKKQLETADNVDPEKLAESLQDRYEKLIATEAVLRDKFDERVNIEEDPKYQEKVDRDWQKLGELHEEIDELYRDVEADFTITNAYNQVKNRLKVCDEIVESGRILSTEHHQLLQADIDAFKQTTKS